VFFFLPVEICTVHVLKGGVVEICTVHVCVEGGVCVLQHHSDRSNHEHEESAGGQPGGRRAFLSVGTT